VKYTVQNEFKFPGELSVGLPTLVQNSPTANNIVNPTQLGQLVVKLNKIGLAVSKPESFWVADYPTQPIGEEGRKEGKKNFLDREWNSQS
jgi:hypothetical protein